MTDPQFTAVASKVIALLVDKKYAEVALLTKGIRLSTADLERAISTYGRTLIPIPNDGYRLMEVTAVAPSSPPCWHVALPLWTKEEGRSDLTLEMTFRKDEVEIEIEVDDIHVL
jgi:hypothetical protein